MAIPLVLDVRSQPTYEAGHAIDAYNIPFDELRDRGFEMPSHKMPLVVECDAADVETVREWFATRDERCRWNVVDVRAASAEKSGPGAPGRFLFSGSPLLAAMEQHVQAAAAAPGSRALDVGSGSGRDAALLCCRYGFDLVCALDRDAKALNRWTRLLDRHQVARESRVAVEATIRAEGDLTAALASLPGPWDLIHAARFLKREMLAELASLLAPGGLLLFHTFCEDPPRAQHAVAPGELRRAFSSLEILRDDVGAIDDGRELSFFAARRPA
ncbi:unnamed protein product [Pelagomonas calceolata]|uniref:Rhodanese domain-containing protein n=1 Tax=Pelagomonas calceolata TaxID=35677 RepID=A0A7S4A645_9STRA|nr:unnamed protein product [Pelagomonas calceolata]|mmetsp:Transcript_15314/g.45129  ORF Transcript_15314/g.45129 Transcript_15314/m.45129 type:complete len:272 (-) Transcript_15314:30-845(-)